MDFRPIGADGRERLVGYSRLGNPVPGYLAGYKELAGRFVPLVATRLSTRDKLGGLAVRWDIGRHDYAVPPGLYAVGDPGPASPLLVSANYKLSFDKLRSALGRIDAWLCVLDTKGVNVWCAAGKGSFGTTELLDKIARLRLGDIISHRVLILPQLGAPGVSAPEIARVSGFRVVWGPVQASDIPAFLAAGMRKTEGMRRVEFRLADRLAVAPVEVAHAWPFALGALALSALAALPPGPGYRARLVAMGAVGLGSIIVGTIAFPALLPILPTRAFSVKGAVLGLLWGLACALLGGASLGLGAAFALIGAAVCAFIGLNYTGSSTFTCQPGAILEVEKSIVPISASLAAGLGLGILSRIFGF